MKIAYVANIRLPTEKAHGYQIMRVCSALVNLGHEVSLFVPTRASPITADPFDFYGVAHNFSLVRVPCADWIRYATLLGPLAFWLTERSFVRALRIPQGSVVYSRDHATAAHFVRKGYRVFYSAHNWKPSRARFLAGVAGVVCNSPGTEHTVRAATRLPTAIAQNAADPNPFAGADAQALRAELSLPAGPLALYAGHLYDWKGAQTLLEAARLAPDVSFVVVGGTNADIARLRPLAPKNFMLLGHRPHAQIPKYLAAADVLLVPNTATSEESARYTSPIKIFEYMASGTPIVASDLPSVRAILSAASAILIEPDNPRALAEGVRSILNNRAAAEARAAAALAESKKYTWENHAASVAAFIESHV